MKTFRLILISLFACIAAATAQTHPRLFFDAADVAGFRAKANTAPWSDMLAAIEWNLERDYTSGYNSLYPNAQAMAALHVFRNSGAAPADYSEQAKLATLFLISAPDSSGNPVWAVNNYKALSRAGRALRVAIAYDLCYSAWVGQTIPASFVAGNGITYNVPAAYVGMDLNAGISLALKNSSDSLVASGGSEWPGDGKTGNNWFAVRYGVAILGYLSCDQPEAGWSANYNTCLTKLRSYLTSNVTKRADANGWNPEGIAYAQYPGYQLFPALIALNRVKGLNLVTEYPALSKSLWATYQGVLPIDRYVRSSAPGDTRIGWGKGLRPDFTDDHNAWDPEGTAALAFAFAPEEYKPGLKWMFRRLCGDIGDQTWDCSSGNGLWSLLYYPASLAEQNPSLGWGNTYSDFSYGVFMFRNRYQDANDFVMQTHGNARPNLGGHQGPDGLSFRIYGLGVPWCVGSGRTSDPRGQTGIFQYDPNSITSSGSPLVPSIIDTFLRPNGDGYTVMNMDTTEIGVSNHTRRIITDYSGASGAPGYFIVSDSSNDGTWWRMNTPDFNTITTSSNSFTITSLEGHKMTVKVLWPLNPVFRTGTFNRPPNFFYKGINSAANSLPYTTKNKWVDFQGNGDGKFLLAITVTENGAAIPAIAATGSGVAQTITAGTRVVTVNENAITVNGWTKPLVAIGSPANGTDFNGGATPISVGGTVSDPDGVQRVELWLDGVFVSNATLDGSGGWSGTLTGVALGSHEIKAVAVDNVNDTGFTTITVKVNSTVPPLVAITHPTSSSPLVSGQSVYFYGTASDAENALNRVEIWGDGAKLANATISAGQWSYTWSGAKTGVHSVKAIAYDNAGDVTETLPMDIALSLKFSPVPKWGDAANYKVADDFSVTQVNLNGTGRWSVREEDGDLRLKVREMVSYDYSSHQIWLKGSDTIGKANWRLDFKYKPGIPLSSSPEAFVFFGAGTDGPVCVDFRKTNTVRGQYSYNPATGTRIWYQGPSGGRPDVAYSFNPHVSTDAGYPNNPASDYAGIPTAGWNDVRIDRVGRTMKVWVNNLLIIDGDSAWLGTKGRIGLGNERNTGSVGFFDNVNLVALDAAGQTVAESPATFAFTEPASGTYAAGVPVTFSGSVTDADETQSVQVYLGSAKLGDAVLGPVAATRSWSLAPWTTVAGTYSLALKCTDALGNVAWSAPQVFRVGAAANVVPSITIGQNPAVLNPNFGVSGTATDADGGIVQIQVFRDGSLSGTTTASGGSWSLTLTGIPTGSYTFTARAIDTLGASTDASFLGTVDSNAPPTVSPIASQAIPQNTSVGPLAFTIGDDVTPVVNLIVSASSGNTTLLPGPGITLGGSGANRTISLTPAAGQSGSALVTISVTDGAGKTGASSFTLNVNAPPVANGIEVSPVNAVVPASGTQQFTAVLKDQFGQPVVPQPSFTWSATGGGSINASGLFSAGTVAGSFSVSASASGFTGNANFSVSAGAGTGNVTVGSFYSIDGGTLDNTSVDTVGVNMIASGASGYDGALTHFATPVTLAATGDKITLTFVTESLASNNNQTWSFRYGLFNSNGNTVSAHNQTAASDLWTGYFAVRHTTTSTISNDNGGTADITANSLFRQGAGTARLVAESVGGGFGAFPAANGVTQLIARSNGNNAVGGDDGTDGDFRTADLPVTVTMVLERTASGLKITTTPRFSYGASGSFTFTDTSPTTYTFNAIAFGSIGNFRVDDVVVSSTIAPPPNTAPTISAIADQTINADTATGTLAVTIGDAETAASSLTLAGVSSNTTLVPNANISFSGSGANRNVIVTPAAGQSDSSTITVTVSDGSLTAQSSFILTVNPANTEPAITGPPDQSIGANTSTGVLAVTIGDAETAVASLTLTASSSDTTLVPDANIVFGGSGANRTVTVTPAANQTGTVTITLTVSDGGLIAEAVFILTVTPSYSSWISAYPGVGGQTGPGDDADGDGLSNLLEYALGSNPGVANPAPAAQIVNIGGQDFLQIQWTRPDDHVGITTVGEVSATLAAWSSDSGDVTTTITPAAPGFETVTIRDVSPLTAQSRRFLRARVLLSP